MKKWEVQDSVKNAFLNPAAAFALGAFCGLAIGMLCMPFSKGIVIGSYNGSNNKESHEEEIILQMQKHQNHQKRGICHEQGTEKGNYCRQLEDEQEPQGSSRTDQRFEADRS
ncbi:MAG: hypothetical protein ACLT29_01680 [Ruminococcus callidus]